MLFFEIVMAYYGAFFVWQLVIGIMNLLFVKIFCGARFSSFRFLNFKIGKRQGKITIKKDKICFLPQMLVIYTPESMSDKKGRIISPVVGTLSGFFCMGLIAWLVYCVAAGTEFCRMYLLGTIIVCAFGLYKFLCIAFSHMGNSPLAVMKRKNEQILALIMEGKPPAELEDWLSEEVELSVGSTTEQYLYIQFQYFCALEKGDEDRVRQLIYKMEKALPQKVPLFLNGICNELIFYYSYFEKDLKKAESFKNRAPSMVESDLDLNGRRVYAYYLYGKEADTDRVLEVIEEGLAVAQEFPMPGSIPIETKLLLHLKDLVQK